MSIIRAPRPEGNFYLLNKAISEDRRLSWAARGVLVFLLGKPDHWRVSPAHLRGETADSAKPTGRDGIYGLLDELIRAGYVHRKQPRTEAGVLGEVTYMVSESPLPDSPYPAGPHPAQPHPANPTLVSIEGKQVLSEAARTENPSCKPDPMEGFEVFWKLYPNGKGKQEAAAAWKRLKPDADLRHTLMTALGQHSVSRDWTKDDGQYVPMASTWLNKKRYLDLLKPVRASAGKSRHTGLNKIDHEAGLELDENGNYQIAGNAQ